MSDNLAGLHRSIHDKLLRIAKANGEQFNAVLSRYATERLLYRLGESEYKNWFVLKGAYLFYVWTGTAHRPTQDIDFLGFGQMDDGSVQTIMHSIIADNAGVEDGLIFQESSLNTQPIRDAESYGGLRVTLLAFLGKIRIPIQIDIGTGDAITPVKKEAIVSSLIDLPQARIFVYPPETVVAEKLEAIVKLGMANSRMKDFFDLWYLSRTMTFDQTVLREAIVNTFARRATPLPSAAPLALTDEFSLDVVKIKLWAAFLSKSRLTKDAPEQLSEVVNDIQQFVMPLLMRQFAN